MKLSFSVLVVFVSLLLNSCVEIVTPVSETIAQVWKIQSVSQGGTTVYPSSNSLYPGYANYKLNLATAPNVSLTEFDGNTFTGTYSLVIWQ